MHLFFTRKTDFCHIASKQTVSSADFPWKRFIFPTEVEEESHITPFVKNKLHKVPKFSGKQISDVNSQK